MPDAVNPPELVKQTHKEIPWTQQDTMWGDPGNIGIGVPKRTDWQVQDDGLGVLTGTVTYTHHMGGDGGTVPDVYVPKQCEQHPFDKRLFCKDYSISYGSNMLATITVNYIGLRSDPAGVTWELSGPTDEDSIDTHPKFAEWAAIGTLGTPTAGNPNPPLDYYRKDGTVNWNYENVEVDNDQRFVGFKYNETNIKRDLVGVKSYKVPRATLKLSFSTSSVAHIMWLTSGLGKYTERIPLLDDKSDDGKMFNVSKSNQSWLLTSSSLSRVANVYKGQAEFTLSGPLKPWNKLIYPKFETVDGIQPDPSNNVNDGLGASSANVA